MKKQSDWTTIITPKKGIGLRLGEVFRYKDLIWLNVVRLFKVKYKQTILGPLWFILQPLLMTLVHTVIFGDLIGLAPNSVPTFLFYMSANVLWLYFSTCLSATSSTFLTHARLFEKVYFPRLTIPISTIISSAIKFLMEFAVFMLALLIYYLCGAKFEITWVALFTPLFVLQLGLLGLGIGLIISALTIKYRDLQVLIGFGLQLLMFLSPVVYGIDSIANPTLQQIIMYNPISPTMELIRYGFLGVGSLVWNYWLIASITTIVILVFGIIIFNRVEKNFTDII